MSASEWALAPLWGVYKRTVFLLPSRDGLFNPYLDEVEGLDKPGSALVRRQNLKNFLTAFPAAPSILLVGEAPGPWGCRFTGVPFTSERQFAEGTVPFEGRQTSANGLPYAERSASIFWDVMMPYFPRFFMWGTVPLHPHLPGNPLSVRTPKPAEVREHLSLMETVLKLMQPEQILAVGRIAQGALTQLDRTYIPIRHPSHGGAAEFRQGIQQAFARLASKSGICTLSS